MLETPKPAPSEISKYAYKYACQVLKGYLAKLRPEYGFNKTAALSEAWDLREKILLRSGKLKEELEKADDIGTVIENYLLREQNPELREVHDFCVVIENYMWNGKPGDSEKRVLEKALDVLKKQEEFEKTEEFRYRRMARANSPIKEDSDMHTENADTHQAQCKKLGEEIGLVQGLLKQFGKNKPESSVVQTTNVAESMPRPELEPLETQGPGTEPDHVLRQRAEEFNKFQDSINRDVNSKMGEAYKQQVSDIESKVITCMQMGLFSQGKG